MVEMVFRIISPQTKQNHLISATSPFKRVASHLLVMWLLFRKTPQEVCSIVKAGPGLIQMGKDCNRDNSVILFTNEVIKF